MYLTIKQQLKNLSKNEYKILRELCRASKDLMNEAIYVARQYYFNNKKYLGYSKIYLQLKSSGNYKLLNSNMGQQSMKVVDSMFTSFIGLLRLVKKNQYSNKAVKLPYYLPKDGYAPQIIQQVNISNQIFTVPYSRNYDAQHSKIKIKVPPILEGKKVKFVKIVPFNNARFFEIQYVYEATPSQRKLNKQKALAIDLGLDNLITCATSEGSSFILDGRRLKSINQWYNKVNAKLASIKDKQKYKKQTKRQLQLARKRKLRINDYISKICKKVIDYCLFKNIGVLVCGYNTTFQNGSNIGRVNNQNFVNIPYGEIRHKLTYLSELYGIEYHEQEESYTSQASFWDKDEIPVYDPSNLQKYSFSGKRIHRGLYRTSTGAEFNADVNGALNILRKSNVVSLLGLYSRGELATPLRIRIARQSNFSRTLCL